MSTVVCPVRAGDRLDLRPDPEDLMAWDLVRLRRNESLAALRVPADDSPALRLEGRWLALDPVDPRTVVLWDRETAEAVAWVETSRRRWRGSILLADEEEELRFGRPLTGDPELWTPDAQRLATFRTTFDRVTGRASVRANVDRPADLSGSRPWTVVLASVMALLRTFHWVPVPVEHRFGEDLVWDCRMTLWDRVWGGGRDGGGFGDWGGFGGGGDGGGGDGG